MSLRPQPVPPVPQETARIARAAFPGGNPYLGGEDVGEREAVGPDEGAAEALLAGGAKAQQDERRAQG